MSMEIKHWKMWFMAIKENLFIWKKYIKYLFIYFYLIEENTTWDDLMCTPEWERKREREIDREIERER